ncbi:hypothetical protein D3C87_1236170 [compost metagenome]
MSQAGGTVGGRHAQINQTVQIFGAATTQASTQKLQTANDPGQHVVEVVGDTSGELADRFHFLRLAQHFLVLAQLSGALFNLLLECFQSVLQAQFALTQVNQPIPGFILSSSATQGGGHQADQRFGMEGPFEERDVAQ